MVSIIVNKKILTLKEKIDILEFWVFAFATDKLNFDKIQIIIK